MNTPADMPRGPKRKCRVADTYPIDYDSLKALRRDNIRVKYYIVHGDLCDVVFNCVDCGCNNQRVSRYVLKKRGCKCGQKRSNLHLLADAASRAQPIVDTPLPPVNIPWMSVAITPWKFVIKCS